MLTESDLKEIARERLSDARALLRAARYDGCTYMAGYAVEIAIKARICRTLRWSGFPETSREWSEVKSLKTHRLETLLLFSGVESRIRTRYLVEWSVVERWSPEQRYERPGSASAGSAKDMIEAATVLRRVI